MGFQKDVLQATQELRTLKGASADLMSLSEFSGKANQGTVIGISFSTMSQYGCL